MSLRTQRLANAFPLWSKARRDSSSLAQKTLSTFAESLEEASITNVRVSNEFHLLKPYLGVGAIYNILLDEDDLFPTESSTLGASTYVYPDVVGTIGATDYTLERSTEIVGFLNALPDRITLKDTRAYSSLSCWSSSSPYTYTSPPWAERLCIVVSGSTFYSRISRYSDREYTGKHVIQLIGKDENDISIREYVSVTDDGVYYTKNIFKDLEDVFYEGFDGTISIKWFPKQNSFETDMYRVIVFDDFEDALALSIENTDSKGYLVYQGDRFKRGEEYRRGDSDTLDNTERLAEIALLNSSSIAIQVVDFVLDLQTARLYVLDTSNYVHVYEHDLPVFKTTTYTMSETAASYVELLPNRSRAKFNETEYIYTSFSRTREKINAIQIKRIAPDGTVRYLQSDKSTWSSGEAWIESINKSIIDPINSWDDFRFSTQYNQYGQWEYSCTTKSLSGQKVSTTSVLVGSLVAKKSFNTGLSGLNGIAFDANGFLSLCSSSNVYRFNCFSDVWLADTRNNQIFLRTEYDSVEVTY
jgi:hypothetical protein